MSATDYRDVTIEHLADDLEDAHQTIRSLREVQSARLDYTHWLQTELCRARDWSMVALVAAWRAELDRRERGRREVAA